MAARSRRSTCSSETGSARVGADAAARQARDRPCACALRCLAQSGGGRRSIRPGARTRRYELSRSAARLYYLGKGSPFFFVSPAATHGPDTYTLRLRHRRGRPRRHLRRARARAPQRQLGAAARAGSRHRPAHLPGAHTGVCANCSPCDVTCGWGGAGAFSDGKLTLSPEVGGWLGEFVPVDTLADLVQLRRRHLARATAPRARSTAP